MKDVDDLIESASELAERGLSKGEIADELNVSRDTASWLVDRAGAPEARDRPAPAEGPQDVHVDWSMIGSDSARLADVSRAIASILTSHGDGVDLTIGIEKAGVPLATMVAQELGTDLATYAPRKHRWEEGDIGDLGGSFSRNFATIEGRECYVVDDTITSGTTMTETIEAIREAGGSPVCCAVLADKQGLDTIDDVAIHALIQVIPVGGVE